MTRAQGQGSSPDLGGTDNETGDAGTIFALIQAMTSPLAGSRAYHHTCFHGDNTNLCLNC